MYLAEILGGTYVHLPFVHLQHKPDKFSRYNWTQRWEDYFNLGSNEVALSDFVTNSDIPNDQYTQLKEWVTGINKNSPKTEEKNNELWEILTSNRPMTSQSGLYVVDLEMLRKAKSFTHFPDGNFLNRIRQKFNPSPKSVPVGPSGENRIRVVIHIRRGDIMDLKKQAHTAKYVDEAFYCLLIHQLNHKLSELGVKLKFVIITNGNTSDFPSFSFKSEKLADLITSNGSKVNNIIFHLDTSPFRSFTLLQQAQVLIPSKSAFSISASLLNENVVLHYDEMLDFPLGDLFIDAFKKDPKHIFINQDGLGDDTAKRIVKMIYG